MYSMFLDEMMAPVMPGKISTKIKNKNKTIDLIGGSEINILKAPGLTEVKFDLLLPQVRYPFAIPMAGYDARRYLDQFERFKISGKPFRWIVNRSLPRGKTLFYSNMMVSLESYEIVEDAEDGFDITVKITLLQYKEYSTKTVVLEPPPPPPPPVEEETTEEKPESPYKQYVQNAIAKHPVLQALAARTAGSPPTQPFHVAQPGETAWNIAQQTLGNGQRYTEIMDLNPGLITNPNQITPGQVLVMPPQRLVP